MKIWLIYKVAMAFWINIHGCQPYPRNSHLCTKSAQKRQLLLTTVVAHHCTFAHHWLKINKGADIILTLICDPCLVHMHPPKSKTRKHAYTYMGAVVCAQSRNTGIMEMRLQILMFVNKYPSKSRMVLVLFTTVILISRRNSNFLILKLTSTIQQFNGKLFPNTCINVQLLLWCQD